MTFLARKNSYSECGFLGFNTKHEYFKQYIQSIIDIYVTGEIFSLEQWHDSWIWDYLRINFEKNMVLKTEIFQVKATILHIPLCYQASKIF